MAVMLGGCAADAPSEPFVVLRTADGSRWIDPDDVERYRCEVGLLFCQSDVGRRSKRLCKCVR